MFNEKEKEGISEGEFKSAQKDLIREISVVRRLDRENPMRLYFEFDNEETRNAAISTLNQLRNERKDYDEAFRYFEGCEPDAKRTEGIEIRFSKNAQGLRNTFEALLSEKGIVPREEYETVAGDPRPEETKINR
jgi:hypothetical protein